MSLSLPAAVRLLLPDGSVINILLEDYLRGVVAAALPADAPLEAMKALAVAARTFAAHTHRHLEQRADLCTARHCQAWSERANPRAARAVLETRGIVGTYDDTFIQAFYFEHCDGKTRDAAGVLVNAPAYLKSAACPCGFASMKGHGIGMCLRGMVAMARFGENYDYILKHYYTGIALEQLGIDESTRVTVPLTPKRAPTPAPKPTPRPRATPRVSKPVEPPAPAPIEKPAPAPKPTAPRRSTRPKIEHTPAPDERAQTPQQTTARPPEKPMPRAIQAKPEIEEADDFVSFLAVKDVTPTPAAPAQKAPTEKPTPIAPAQNTSPQKSAPEISAPLSLDAALAVALGHDEPPPQPSAPPISAPPVIPAAPPPASMPEDLPEAIAPRAVQVPPASMPEDLPNALELEFIAAPIGAPEDVLTDFTAPPTVTIIEPDLDAFIPPVERFYAPLDAPPTLPEDLPSFSAARVDETPIAWIPPPPLFENADAHQPHVLMDSLPGPRVIAGNLAKPGTLITVRDASGNRIVTVSGVAKQYGAGGFEAPLTDDGAYHVKFDNVEMDVQVMSETVFIYYQ